MTPIYRIKSNGSIVWAKLESHNPTGTHKDRSIAPWILHYTKEGVREFAIASSGNSALSAIKYCTGNNFLLHVFVSPNSAVLPRIQGKMPGLFLHISKTPRRDAIRFCRKNNIVNLRASTDDYALVGYRDIARELMEQLPKIDNIFIPVSSGATLEGIYNGFNTGKPPSFFAIQTAKVHPIASCFDKNFKKENESHATSIVDNIAHRRDKAVKICKETGGGGFVISNKELEEGKKFLYEEACFAKFERSVGWHSTLAFAGFLKWAEQNPEEYRGKVSVCLFTD